MYLHFSLDFNSELGTEALVITQKCHWYKSYGYLVCICKRKVKPYSEKKSYCIFKKNWNHNSIDIVINFMTKYSCDLAIQNYLGAIFEINTTILLKSIYFAETYIEFITWFHEFSVTVNLRIFKKLSFVIYSYVLLM